MFRFYSDLFVSSSHYKMRILLVFDIYFLSCKPFVSESVLASGDKSVLYCIPHCFLPDINFKIT